MLIWSSLILVLPIVVSADNSTRGVWANAPPFARDKVQPYPSLVNEAGKNITIEDLSGARLFGFKGCKGKEQTDAIKQAYEDFNELASQEAVYDLDWGEQASTDFWGPSNGTNQIPDFTRLKIKQIFIAAKQIYHYSWWKGAEPDVPARKLWIEIRCSDGKTGANSTDPWNVCGDVRDGQQNRGNCINGDMPADGDTREAYAFSNNSETWSLITICKRFYDLPKLSDAVKNAQELEESDQLNLTNWDNRARVFFHEITQLDYLMQGGDIAGYSDTFTPVADLQINLQDGGSRKWRSAHGVRRAKILRNWIPSNPFFSGYFTQRNADNYAWFALAKYAENVLGTYPNVPSPGSTKPLEMPRVVDTQGQIQGSSNDTQVEMKGSSNDTDLIGGDDDGEQTSARLPGCSDKSYFKASDLEPLPACNFFGDPFPRAMAEQFINNFCGDHNFWDVQFVPPIALGTGQTAGGRRKLLERMDKRTFDDATSAPLYLGTRHASANCTSLRPFTEGAIDEDKFKHCVKRFLTVLDGCQMDNQDDKLGGILLDNCIEYRIARKRDGETAPFHYPQVGSFKCREKTDVATGGNSNASLSACPCWYESDESHSANFKVPASGQCDGDVNRGDVIDL